MRWACAIAAALLASAILPAAAQTPDVTPTASIEPRYFEVTGLSPGDQLNLRANASPTGMMIGRLTVGSVVRNLGCTEVGKNHWCKIADVNNENMQGWAAARYLVETQYDEPGIDGAPAEGSGDAGSFPDIDNSGASILPQ